MSNTRLIGTLGGVCLLIVLITVGGYFVLGSDSQELGANDGNATSKLADGLENDSTVRIDGVRLEDESNSSSEERSAYLADDQSESLAWKFDVVSSDGRALSGRIFGWKCDGAFVEYINRNLMADAEKISDHFDRLDFRFKEGMIEFDRVATEGEFFFWIYSDDHYAESRFVTLPKTGGDSAPIVLRPSSRQVISVYDETDAPLSGIRVGIYDGSLVETQYLSLGWRERLAAISYDFSEVTDTSGQVVVSSPPSDTLNIGTWPTDQYASGLVENHGLGEECRIVLERGFYVEGTVLAKNGEAVADAAVLFFVADSDAGSHGIGQSTSDDNGEYYIESMAVKGHHVIGLIIKDGYTSGEVRIHAPRKGGRYRGDFVIEKGVEVEFKVGFESGRPVEGAELFFYRNPYSWVPGSYITDENGVTVTQESLAAGRRYVLYLRLPSGPWQQIAIKVPDESPYRVEVKLPSVGKLSCSILGDHDLGEPNKLVFVPNQSTTSRVWEWNIDEVSPWIYSGPGKLYVVWDSGLEAAFDVVVPIGAEREIEAVVETGVVRFELPKSDVGSWSAELKSDDGRELHQWSLTWGQSELEIPHGIYNLEFEGEEGDHLRAGPFNVRSSGVDLGAIVNTQRSGRIFGWAKDDFGNGLDGVPINLLRVDGFDCGDTSTDEDGFYEFSSLSGGAYIARAAVFDGTFIPVPAISRRVELPTGQAEVRADIFVSMEQSLQVRLLGDCLRMTRAFYSDSNALQISDLEANGTATFFNHHSQAIVGSCFAEGNRLGLVILDVPSDVRERSFDCQNLVRREIRIIDVDGRPLPGAVVVPMIAGTRMQASVASNESGEVEILAHVEDSIDLLIEVPSVGLRRFNWSQIPVKGDLMISPDSMRISIKVVGVDGIPIGGVQAHSQSGLSCAATDRSGEAELYLADDSETLMLFQPGYWKREISTSDAQPVVLRRIGKTIFVQVDSRLDVDYVELKPLFEVEFLEQRRFEESTANGWDFQLNGMPEGRYELRGVNEDLEVKFRVEFDHGHSTKTEVRVEYTQ